MAKIVDIENAPGDLDGLEQSLQAAVAENASKEEAEVKEVSDEVKEVTNEGEVADPLAGTKFEGKSVEDLLDSYNNLQSAYGRMANDLGSQRKLTDRLLDLKREEDLTSNAQEPVKVTGAELLDDPTKALDDVISAREARMTSMMDERLQSLEAQLQTDRFMQKHPDFMTIGQSPDFQEWAQSTPLLAQTAQRAAAGDWDSADVLLTEWKAMPKETRQDAGTEDNAANLEAARKASLESTNQAGDSDASAGKTYSRADLIRLKIERPDTYADPAFQQEILKAYAEGRVK